MSLKSELCHLQCVISHLSARMDDPNNSFQRLESDLWPGRGLRSRPAVRISCRSRIINAALAKSIEIKILLSIQAGGNYNPRKANKTAGLSAALSHYSHWGDARYQNSEHAERLAARGETRRIIRREKPCLTAKGSGTVMLCMCCLLYTSPSPRD